MYSHAVPRHTLCDVEVEKDFAHRHTTTKQVEDAGEEHPADILNAVVEVDYKAARTLSGWATRHQSAGYLHTLVYHTMRKAKLVVLRRRTFLLPTMDASCV